MVSKKSMVLIEQHEARKHQLYYDSEDVPTAGVGHNLLKPFSDKMIDLMFEEDLMEVMADCQRYDWYPLLDPVRQAVIENMMFNLGSSRFAGFKKSINYIERGDYAMAATEMLDSRWAKQVRGRAIDLSYMMRTGRWHVVNNN